MNLRPLGRAQEAYENGAGRGCRTAAIVLLIASYVVAASPGYAPNPEILQAEGRSLLADTTRVEGRWQSSGVNWILVAYESSEGPCFDLYGETDEGDAASVGSCGVSMEGLWAPVGSVDLGGKLHNLSYGKLPTTVSEVRITLASGKSVKPEVTRGFWLWETVDESPDVALVEAIDQAGAVVDEMRPPSLSG